MLRHAIAPQTTQLSPRCTSTHKDGICSASNRPSNILSQEEIEEYVQDYDLKLKKIYISSNALHRCLLKSFFAANAIAIGPIRYVSSAEL